MCDIFWVLTYPSLNFGRCSFEFAERLCNSLTLCCSILSCKTSACQLTPCSRRGHRTSAAKLSWCMPHGMGFCGTYPAGNVPYLNRDSERHDRWTLKGMTDDPGCTLLATNICHPVWHFLSRWYDPRCIFRPGSFEAFWIFRGPGCKWQSWRCWTLPIWTVLQILPGWSAGPSIRIAPW